MSRPKVAPDLVDELSPETMREIEETLAGSPVCTVCDLPIRPELEPEPSVIALRHADGTAAIRFAHKDCAAPRLITAARPPTPALTAAGTSEPPAADDATAWALLVREYGLPTVTLVCDVDQFAALDVRGEPLLAALRLDGLRGGRPIDQLQPAPSDTITVTRDSAHLQLHTPWGREPLELTDSRNTVALLHLAARQGAILVILGRGLALGAGTLDETERQLCFADAIATTAAYTDPELAAVPLHGHGRRRIVRQLAALAPSRRARRRTPHSD
jgi:hypothetical protein